MSPSDLPAWVPLSIIAPFIGSFLGLLTVRIPARPPLVRGRSRCDACGKALPARDLIPLVSYLARGGRCGFCKALIDPLHPVIEFGALGVVLWAATVVPNALLAPSVALGWLLLLLAAIDFRTFRLPDILNAILCAGGVLVTVLFMRAQLTAHLLGIMIGFGTFWTVGQAYYALRHRHGLGLGDAKLLGALGAWVSWEGLPTVLFYAAGLALLATVLAGRSRVTGASRIPFAPFLVLAGWLVWLYGPLTLGG